MIYFHYPWSEDDDIEITLPDGFSLDNADAPAPFGSKELSQYKVSIAVTKDTKTLIYKRNFSSEAVVRRSIGCCIQQQRILR